MFIGANTLKSGRKENENKQEIRAEGKLTISMNLS